METHVTNSHACDLDLFEEQRKLEEESRVLGRQRFEKMLADASKSGEASREGAYHTLVIHGLEVVEAEMTRMVEQPRRKGGRHLALRWIELFDEDRKEGEPREGPGIVAYLALRVALDGIAQGASVVEASTRLSSFIVDELRYRRLKRDHPQLFDYKLRSFAGGSSHKHMKGSLDMTLKYTGVDVAGLHLTNHDKIVVGCKLLDVVASVTGLINTTHGLSTKIVSTSRRGRRRNTTLKLEPGPDVVKWIGDKNEWLADFAYVLYPLVIPPQDWGPMQRGGYYHNLRGAFPLIGGNTNSEVTKAQERREQPLVFGSLNTLQKTAWRINPHVLSLVEQLLPELKVKPGALAGLESYEPEAHPIKTQALLEDRQTWMDWMGNNRGALSKRKKIPDAVNAARLRWREWRRKVGEIKDRDVPRRSRVVAQKATVAQARRMAGFEAIYFPYTLDFRGRVYTKASHLNPQGDDLNKSLLTFATGKALGDEGARWLAIHGANAFDTTPEGEKIGRMTLDEREKWILRQTSHIRRSVHAPLEYRWWMQADKPLQFYAFCVEWVAALDERAKTGEWSYVSTLPVSMDGSCNGLQHFSAMFRDEIGGASVNLTNNDRPRDVYSDMSDAVKEWLVAHASDPLAVKWLASGLVNRKLTKRPTMTFGYGAKKWGFRDQLFTELKSRSDYAKVKQQFSFEEDGRVKEGLLNACTFLSTAIHESLGSTVVAAARAMLWLQTYAAQIAGSNNSVEWTVPVTGFRVRQEYFKSHRRRINTTLAGKVRLSSYDPSQEVRAHKQANAVSPNIIHSLDAAVMMLTVQECMHEGINHFRMVHDSFGTLAADASKMAEITRRVFVQFYSTNDVPKLLAAQLNVQLPEGSEIPAMPEYGKLDLNEVLDSKYFFA